MKRLEMEVVDGDKRARDEEVEEVFTSKSASPKAGRPRGASACALSSPAERQARYASVVGPSVCPVVINKVC